jgi:hypothetical protein
VGAEWVATGKPPDRQVRTAQDAESLYRLGGIPRARWGKAAGSSKNLGKKQLICPDDHQRKALGGVQAG